LEVGSRVVEAAFEVAVNAQPMHLPTVHHLFLTDNRDVILGVTRDYTRATADTGTQINRHAPGITFVLVFGIQGWGFK
jgi:hypothetical protein